MSAKNFQLTILSAEKELFADQVESVTLPTEAGEITALAQHTPIFANLKAGELMIRAKGKQEFLFVGGGVMEFTPRNECRILADVAERIEEIDLQKAEEARLRAERELGQAKSGPEVFAAKAALFQALARIHAAEKNRKLRGRH